MGGGVLASSDGISATPFSEAVGFGLDFLVLMNARAAGTLVGDGTWFWVDPSDDVIFVDMIQRMGLTGRDSLATMARTLIYQALAHPEPGRPGQSPPLVAGSNSSRAVSGAGADDLGT